MYQKTKEYFRKYLKKNYPEIFEKIRVHKTGIKYVISGGTAAVIQVGLLYVFTDILGLYYVASAATAFLIALITSFFLQKFWTFRDNNLNRIKKQLAIYAFLGVLNFFLNPTLLYLVVEWTHVWYVIGQIIVMGVLAVESFLVNKFITFKKEIEENGIKL
jgi:dolichol-phosphate mannosyltransferase